MEIEKSLTKKDFNQGVQKTANIFVIRKNGQEVTTRESLVNILCPISTEGFLQLLSYEPLCSLCHRIVRNLELEVGIAQI